MGGCLNPLLLRIIYLVKIALNVIRFVIPMILIFKLILDVYKYIINNKEDFNKKLVINRMLASVIIFFVPTLVSFVLNLVGGEYSGLNQCLEFANTTYIKELETKRDEEEMALFLTEKEKNLSAYEKKVAEVRAVVKSQEVINKVGTPASKNKLIKCGSGSTYNTALFNAVRSAGFKTREGVVAAATYLSSHIDVHIPYFWSGGHYHSYDGYKDYGKNMIGVPDKWGCVVKMAFGGTDKQKNGVPYPFGVDCSGFITWAILNGGYYVSDGKQKIIISTDSLSKYVDGVSVDTVTLENAKGKAKPGDILYKKGHVGLILEVNGDTYTIAEAKGYDNGLIISKIKNERFTHVMLMDKFYNNYYKNEPLWEGFK